MKDCLAALTDLGRGVAERAARELPKRFRGFVRLAVPMSVGLRWATPLLAGFIRLYPNITVPPLGGASVDLIARSSMQQCKL